ncbi:MAG: hypothetical protein AAF617_18370, partial [Bacteroidota bacterium]
HSMKIIQKKVHELNHSEREQLATLIKRYYNSASPEFIADRLDVDYGFDIVMIKKGDIIQGVNFYHLIKYKEKRWKRTHFILHFGQVMKRSGYRGNIIWTLGNWYSRRNISKVYLLQNVTGFASFISPKAFEHYLRLFPRHHFEMSSEKDSTVQQFTVDYFTKVRGITVTYNANFCFDTLQLQKEDITDDWNKVYRAKNEKINQLFIDKEIIVKEDNRMYKMPRHITVCGVHRPMPFDKKLRLPDIGALIDFKSIPIVSKNSLKPNIISEK